jgi:hypothetical protein
VDGGHTANQEQHNAFHGQRLQNDNTIFYKTNFEQKQIIKIKTDGTQLRIN